MQEVLKSPSNSDQRARAEALAPPAPVKLTLEKKIRQIEIRIQGLPDAERSGFRQRLDEIKREEEEDNRPASNIFELLLKTVKRLARADQLELAITAKERHQTGPEPKSPWQNLAEQLTAVDDKSRGKPGRAKVEGVAEEAMRRIKQTEAEEPKLLAEVRTVTTKEVEVAKTVEVGVPQAVSVEEKREQELREFREETERQRKHLPDKGKREADIFLDTVEELEGVGFGDSLSSDLEERLLSAGGRLLAHLPEAERPAFRERLEKLDKQVQAALDRKQARRMAQQQEVEAAAFSGKKLERLLLRQGYSEEVTAPMVADFKRMIREGASPEEVRARLKEWTAQMEDPEYRERNQSELMRALRAGNVEGIAQGLGATAEDIREVQALRRAMEQGGQFAPEDMEYAAEAGQNQTRRRRGANLEFQGWSPDDIQRMQDHPEEFVRELLDLAHGSATTAKSPERSGFFHKLNIAIMEIAENYREGHFAFDQEDPQQRERLWNSVVDMYRSRFGLISALNTAGIEQDGEKRIGTLPYFGTVETGWFNKQWWFKLARLETAEHPDLAYDLLNMGERFGEVDAYLENAQVRANKWLEKWITEFNGPEQHASKALGALFDGYELPDGTRLGSLRQGSVEDRARFIGEVRKITQFGSDKFGLSKESFHVSYDFMRWNLRLAELDSRYIMRNEKGESIGFLYDPRTPPDWRVLLAYKLGGTKMVDDMIAGERDDKVKAGLVAEKRKQLYEDDAQKIFRSKAQIDYAIQIAEIHWQKTKESFRRGEFEAGPRSLMNWLAANKRLGRSNLVYAELFDKLLNFRGIDSTFYLGALTDKKKLEELGITDVDAFIARVKGEVSLNDGTEAYASKDASFINPFAVSYGRFRKPYKPSESGREFKGGVDIDGALRDQSIEQGQVDALQAMGAFEAFASEKATTIRDYHLDMMGQATAKPLAASIMENPLKEVEPGGALSKFDRGTLISQMFKTPSTGSNRPIEGYSPFYNFARRVLNEPLAPTLNQEIHLKLLKQTFAMHPGTYEDQVNLLHNLTRGYYLNLPYETSLLSPKRLEYRYKNWLMFQRMKFYVLGPEKVFADTFGRGGSFLFDYLKAFFVETTKGTEIESIGKTVGGK